MLFDVPVIVLVVVGAGGGGGGGVSHVDSNNCKDHALTDTGAVPDSSGRPRSALSTFKFLVCWFAHCLLKNIGDT